MGDYTISIIIPVYNEADQVSETVDRLLKLLDEHSIEREFLLVDDGSTDGTWNSIVTLSKRHACIGALKLSRNFGKESAICAGLRKARGDACIIMDSDLQHPPSLIPQMVQLWKQGYEVVEGIKSSRGEENFTSRLGASVFYKVLKTLSGYNLENASDFKLLDRKVVEAWAKMGERNTFFRGMSSWVGFRRTHLYFDVPGREKGKSKWSFFKLFKLAVNAITAFSSVPLQVVTFLGTLFLAGSVVLAVQTLYRKFTGQALSGFTTVILLQLLIGSTLMISLGIIGTYIARIYDEVKGRPRYIVAEEIKPGTGRDEN